MGEKLANKRKPTKEDLNGFKENWWEYEFESYFCPWADKYRIGIERKDWLPYWEAWKDGYAWGYEA